MRAIDTEKPRSKIERVIGAIRTDLTSLLLLYETVLSASQEPYASESGLDLKSAETEIKNARIQLEHHYWKIQRIRSDAEDTVYEILGEEAPA